MWREERERMVEESAESRDTVCDGWMMWLFSERNRNEFLVAVASRRISA